MIIALILVISMAGAHFLTYALLALLLRIISQRTGERARQKFAPAVEEAKEIAKGD